MPIAKFQMDDGRIARFEVPEGTTPEQAQSMMQEHFAPTKQPEQPKPEQSWGDVVSNAAGSAIPSTWNLVKGLGHAVIHPLDTAGTALDLAAGGLRNALPESLVNSIDSIDPNAIEGQKAQELASLVGHQYKKDYGSISGLKEKISSDPAGIITDVATLLTGGGGAVTKLPKLGAIGETMVKAGTVIDPLANTLKLGSKGLGLAGSAAQKGLGMTTGAGAASIEEAYGAGKQGGLRAEQFTQNLRRDVPKTDVLDLVDANIQAMGKAKSDAYKAGMSGINSDKTVLSMDKIGEDIANAYGQVTYKGQIKNAKGAEVLKKISDTVGDWKELNPTEFHTAEGLDALKQSVGGIVESIPFEEKTAKMVGNNIYNSIKSEITKQAPAYAKTMKEYQEASELMKEIRQTLSNKPNASVDTQMRKLQSLMRNDVNTNYGNRIDLVKQMEQQGGQSVIPSLAGQSLSTWTPRGLQSATTIPTALGAAAAGGFGLGAAMIPLASPHIMGEASFKAGQIAKLLKQGGDGVNDILDSVGGNPTILNNYLYQAGNKDQLAEQLRRK
jgi:hypothetical protein